MKTGTKFSLMTGIGLLACNLLLAQSPMLPLDTVLARISSANTALLAYNAKINAQNEYAKGAKNLDAPKLSAGQYQVPYMLNPNGGSFMVQAEQMFTNPAKLKAKEKYMHGVSAVTAQQQAWLKNELMAQARQSYYDAVMFTKKLAILQNTRQVLEYMLKDANIKLTYGKEKLSNIYKAKADLYELDNTEEQLNNAIKQQLVMLNTLMNRDKQTVFLIDTNAIARHLEPADTTSLALRRSDIKMIDSNMQLQQLSADMEYSKRKPDFGIQAGHMFSYGGFANQYILMASVTIPIVPWASKEYKSNLKGIRYELEQLQNEKQSKLNEAEGQLAALKLNMDSKQKQINNYNQNIIPAMHNSYKTALLAYEQNTGDLPSVLNGIKDLQAARMSSLDRLQELLQLQVAYEKENERY